MCKACYDLLQVQHEAAQAPEAMLCHSFLLRLHAQTRLTIDAALARAGGDLSGAGAGVKGQFGNCAFIWYIWFSVGELYTADEMFSSSSSEPCSDSQSHNSTAPYTAVT